MLSLDLNWLASRPIDNDTFTYERNNCYFIQDYEKQNLEMTHIKVMRKRRKLN